MFLVLNTFTRHTMVAVGKAPPAGMGGEGWNAPNVIEMPNAWDKQLLHFTEWKHPRGIMHGLVDNLKLVLLKKADPKL
uniref:hypothetical protein n=1 Tax=Ornithobacterium rhinotracheale TaxID=28251 RepID=UPI001C866EFF|nr:hypothetical protein [Ornithobacterium rhinotracheale]